MLAMAVIAGAALYYLQVFHFYDRVQGPVITLVPFATDTPERIAAADIQAIDAESSPIRYRACFTTTMSLALLTETYRPGPEPEPLTGPGWFDCYDADGIAEGLESGEALSFLGHENITYGIDRLVAVFADGRGFAWHQINRCGAVVFDGEPVPEDCPAPPERD